MGKSNVKQKPVHKKEPSKQAFPQINIYVALGLFLFAFVLYANTLGHGFVLDDPLAIEFNKNVTSGFSGIGDILKGGYRENNFGGQLYRPVSLIQFAVEWQISPNNPFIHHFFNVLWFGLTVVLMFFVLRQWLPKKNIVLSLATALIFAAHPIHTEVVANIKSRDEIMSLFFILASFYLYSNYLDSRGAKWLMAALGAYFLALISKESAVTVFPIFGMISWWLYGKNVKQSIINGFFFLVPVLVLFLIRYSIFGAAAAPVVDIMDNPIVSASGWMERMATSIVILWQYISLLIFPHPLSSDYSYSVIPVTDFGNITAIMSLSIHLCLAVIAVKMIKTRSFISFTFIAYFMAISLYSQIPMIIGTMFGERLAYLPSFWFVAGVVYLLFTANKDSDSLQTTELKSFWNTHKILTSSIVLVSILFSIKTISRNSVWKDNYTLFTTDAATYPVSVRLNNGAADQLLKAAGEAGLTEEEVNNRLTKAEEYCNKIMKIRPVATAFLTLGNIRMKQKKYEESIAYYDQVNDLKNIVDRNKALAYRELGRQAGEKEQNIVKSQDMLTKSLALNEGDAETWYLMGVSYGVSGNHQKAAENFEKAYQINPTPQYAKNVMAAYQYLGNQQKVAQYQALAKGK